MEKCHDRRGSLLLALAAIVAVLLAYLMIWQGIRMQGGRSVYADAVLVSAGGEVRRDEA